MLRNSLHRLGRLGATCSHHHHRPFTALRALPRSSSFTWTATTTTTFRSMHSSSLKQSALAQLRSNGVFKRLMSNAAATATATNTTAAAAKATVTKPIVAYWLYFNAGLVFAIVVVGGLTRLTESGLSITEWNVISGMKPPRSEQEWIEEFEKYKQYPEYKL